MLTYTHMCAKRAFVVTKAEIVCRFVSPCRVGLRTICRDFADVILRAFKGVFGRIATRFHKSFRGSSRGRFGDRLEAVGHPLIKYEANRRCETGNVWQIYHDLAVSMYLTIME